MTTKDLNIDLKIFLCRIRHEQPTKVKKSYNNQNGVLYEKTECVIINHNYNNQWIYAMSICIGFHTNSL